jgi:hypothetical protein
MRPKQAMELTPSPPEVQFSGVTRQDVREIELLVAPRADILKPILREGFKGSVFAL